MIAETDFFKSRDYERDGPSWRSRRLGLITDALFDLPLALCDATGRVRREASQLPVQRVLVASVNVPHREAELEKVLAALRRTRHDVTVALAPVGDRGKFHNINLALHQHDISAFDWLIVTDDDIALPPGFVDNFLYLATKAKLHLCQPAHRFHSFNRFLLTYRAWNSLVRLTNFVESGPITAFHRDSLGLLLPFPELRWSWGVDITWSEIGRRHDLRLGIIDATPIEHLKPISSNYDYKVAIAEAMEFLRQQGVTSSKKDILKNLGVVPI